VPSQGVSLTSSPLRTQLRLPDPEPQRPLTYEAERSPMPQTTTFEHRQSQPRHAFDTHGGQILDSAHGDFARGQRHDSAAAYSPGDFATGMRTTAMSRVVGDFATGMRTLPRTATPGDFATGMRTGSEPVAINRFRSPASALPVAA
jgi:hypothetical protein